MGKENGGNDRELTVEGLLILERSMFLMFELYLQILSEEKDPERKERLQ